MLLWQEIHNVLNDYSVPSNVNSAARTVLLYYGEYDVYEKSLVQHIL